MPDRSGLWVAAWTRRVSRVISVSRTTLIGSRQPCNSAITNWGWSTPKPRKPTLLRTASQRSGTIVLTNELLTCSTPATVAAKMATSSVGDESALDTYALSCAVICCVVTKHPSSTAMRQGVILCGRTRFAPAAVEPARRKVARPRSGVGEAGAQRLGDGVRARLRLQLGDDLGDVELGGVRRDA